MWKQLTGLLAATIAYLHGYMDDAEYQRQLHAGVTQKTNGGRL